MVEVDFDAKGDGTMVTVRHRGWARCVRITPHATATLRRHSTA